MNPLISTFLCWLVSDFLSGVFHWCEDNYAHLGMMGFLGKWIVDDNIEHHRSPGSILFGTFWETNRVLIVSASVLSVVCQLSGVRLWQVYLTLFFGAFSNQVHKWAHTRRVPVVVGWFQRLGIFQSCGHHSMHHRKPYGIRYCTSTPILNPILDSIRFWRALEWSLASIGLNSKRGAELREGY
jgi:ubiquitin-conjugating enzyme E2 variant